jgi:hypothetical protein
MTQKTLIPTSIIRQTDFFFQSKDPLMNKERYKNMVSSKCLILHIPFLFLGLNILYWNPKRKPEGKSENKHQHSSKDASEYSELQNFQTQDRHTDSILFPLLMLELPARFVQIKSWLYIEKKLWLPFDTFSILWYKVIISHGCLP